MLSPQRLAFPSHKYLDLLPNFFKLFFLPDCHVVAVFGIQNLFKSVSSVLLSGGGGREEVKKKRRYRPEGIFSHADSDTRFTGGFRSAFGIDIISLYLSQSFFEDMQRES